MTINSYNVLTGVGRMYLAPVGTAFPDVDDAPSGSWIDLGDTQDGVDVDLNDKIELVRTDQRTGPVKATRTEESMKVKTKLAEATLENLAYALGVSVTDTAPGVGTIGTRSIPTYRGAEVAEYAILFRGGSPYGDYNAQYQVPRAYFTLDALKYEKGKNLAFPITIEALEDLNAATASERFGKLIAQDASALP